MGLGQAIWWPAKQCLVFCICMSNPALGQILIEVAAATKETKHPRHVQIKFESFSFSVWVACWSPFCHSSVPILWNVSGNYE